MPSRPFTDRTRPQADSSSASQPGAAAAASSARQQPSVVRYACPRHQPEEFRAQGRIASSRSSRRASSCRHEVGEHERLLMKLTLHFLARLGAIG
jgi:hypothetical protein